MVSVSIKSPQCVLSGAGAPPLGVSGPHWKKNCWFGHTLNTLRHIITKTSHTVFSKFMILCRATFTASWGMDWTPLNNSIAHYTSVQLEKGIETRF